MFLCTIALVSGTSEAAVIWTMGNIQVQIPGLNKSWHVWWPPRHFRLSRFWSLLSCCGEVNQMMPSHSCISGENISKCKLFILFAYVKHFQFGFGELAAVCSISCLRVKHTENWPQQQKQQKKKKQTNSWNQPLPLDLQCPPVWLATKEEILPAQADN